MKLLTKAGLAALLAVSGVNAMAEGWPASYKGVMLQGFYWDSYTDTKWINLEAKADEYSKYFSLIWVPNSGNCGSGNQMGYMPIYWFTNHNSSFGTEAELRSMISTYKSKGTGIIADVVINHRNGRTSWADFPTETWNGQSWHIGAEGICCNDNWASNGGNPTGNYDTGEQFDGCRDLDHTNANVQANCKAYISCLLTDYGYSGVRYDMSKGYSGEYNKIYNKANNVKYSVGEYWDGSYDAVAAWIDKTDKESAAFDFPFKYQLNKAFSNNDMRELSWNAYGTTPQPAGMIHANYSQYAVTFIDNHDTYRNDNKFTGDVLAANAFMLCSPGTPCVFLPHYKQYTSQIQTMINIRNAAGVTNTSKVTVNKVDAGVYVAVIEGTNGKVGVRIGSGSDVPSGFSGSPKISGDKFAIWCNNDIDDPTGGTSNGELTGGKIYWNNSSAGWSTVYCYAYNLSSGSYSVAWPGTAMTKEEGDIWSASIPEGYDCVIFTNGSGSQYPGANEQGFDFHDGYIYDANGGKKYNSGSGTGGSTDHGGKIYWNNTATAWTSVYCYAYNLASGTYPEAWPGLAMTKEQGDVWSVSVPAGYDCVIFSNGSGTQYPGANQQGFDFHDGYIYDANGGKQYGSGSGSGEGDGSLPAHLYVMGNLEGHHWETNYGVEMTRSGNVYTAQNVKLEALGEDGFAYFTLVTQLAPTAEDWDATEAGVNFADRYGAPAENTPAALGTDLTITKYPVNVSASAAQSWKITQGTYDISADLSTMKLRVSLPGTTGVEVMEFDLVPARYFNLQGVEVSQPVRGLYIVVRGDKVSKEVVR